MSALILGLLMFLGMHSARILAEGWRSQVIERQGAMVWKLMYAGASAIGLGLIIWGYAQTRMAPQLLWASPLWTRHIAALLVLASMVLLVAAYVPRNAIKAGLHHPLVLSVKLWALAHLLANNTLADLLLFGSFLLWSLLAFRAARQRDRAAGAVYASGTWAGTLATLAIGVGLWAMLAFWLHALAFGVRPFGGG